MNYFLMVLAHASLGIKAELHSQSFLTNVNLVKWKIIFLKFSYFSPESSDDFCKRDMYYYYYERYYNTMKAMIRFYLTANPSRIISLKVWKDPRVGEKYCLSFFYIFIYKLNQREQQRANRENMIFFIQFQSFMELLFPFHYS